MQVRAFAINRLIDHNALESRTAPNVAVGLQALKDEIEDRAIDERLRSFNRKIGAKADPPPRN